MVDTYRAFNKQRSNLKVETVYGTLETAITTQLDALRMVPGKDGSTDLYMAGGSSLATLATRIDDFTSIDYNGRLTFQDPMWIWGSLIGAPTTTQPGTLAYQHVFSWNGRALVAPKAYSLAYGDAESAVEVPGVIFNSMSWTAGRGAVTEISGTAFGKKQVQGKVIYPRQSVFTLTITASGGTYTITWQGQTTAAIAYNANAATILAALEALSNVASGDLAVTGTGPWTITPSATGAFAGTNVTATIGTGSLTGGTGTLTETQEGGPVVAIPATPISPLLFDVWADSSGTGADWSDLGTTQLLGCMEFELGMGDRWIRVQPMKSNQSADGIAEGETQTHTVRMKLLYDGVAESMFDDLEDGNMLFVRLQAEGETDQIESGHTYLYRQDQAILLESVGKPESFGGGVMAIDVSGQLAASSADNEAIEVTMKNEVAAIV